MTEVIAQEYQDEHEEGEISDDDEAPLECPVSKVPIIDYRSSDDEQTSEDLLKKLAKQAEERKKVESAPLNPALCSVCQKNEHKYRCPRCNLRSCSLQCSKQHKIDNECDGIRQPYNKLEKLSQFDPRVSIEDQKFMSDLKEKAGLGAECGSTSEVNTTEGETAEKDPNDLRYTTNSATEKYLLNAARSRHIWLGFTGNSTGNESRHEQFSDTIFWTLQLTFRKQIPDGSVDEYIKVVNNIPETIRLITILKQFFKPRKFGCIVSETDLDMTKMEAFIQRGVESINLFMEVHGYTDRFYGCLAENTLLESTRNRVVADHPKLIITLNDEFTDMQLLSSEELEKVSERYRGISQPNDRSSGRGGRGGGGGRQFNRGGGGGGGRGGFGNNRKRPNQGHGNDGGWKRGRGGPGGHRGGGQGGQRRNFQNRNPQDSFDPFEPFSGTVRLPNEYGTGQRQ